MLEYIREKLHQMKMNRMIRMQMLKTDGANDGLYGDYKLGTKIIYKILQTEPTTPAPTETTPESTKAPEKNYKATGNNTYC